ncbi:transcriptional regulator [Veronia nyctiphanis]|uniref:Transcriptional regulator n=1 Tax=Veronia nyctiphanis TaxID=1278244 RepID=A0A4Q0YUU3_9GAMM|nr:nuclear transport factor 2 family protein [Veronia nyctiphanis]RXJ74595.1 transcriptional regulator [Veronia nyctiphanis]
MIDSIAVSEKSPVEQFVTVYEALGKNNLAILDTIYSDDVVFEDPAHRIEGFENLSRYFDSLYENIIDCKFKVHNHAASGDIAFVNWTMTLAHPKLAGGKLRAIEGSTMLTFKNGKVTHHRDFFDLGAMLYEAVPVLGPTVKFLKKRLGQ